MRAFFLLTLPLVLTACGGSSHRDARVVSAPVQAAFATGPIYSACRASDREASNRQLCGCIQAVADRELSSRDENRIAGFFNDPEEAHAVKISDTSANDAFWDRYRDFIGVARRTCS
ncbi:hypothetical protein DFK10_03555 [Salibaculum griseiflavum]|jgi:hypothetical protein|uniref:Arginine transporter n=1 Tax=Salibaculum griseiflavum TaxID=1914409 RepID=A0A2V1P5L8_9RHOB|nr:hypothetical protein DFK10_03555 [Salibaculum griseiflavum]